MRALAVAMLVGLAACSSGSGKKSVSPTTTATTAVGSTVAAGAPKTTAAQAATTTRGPDLSLTSFQTPTGNIGCDLGTGGARCDIREHSYKPPPTPPDCPLDYGDSLEFEEPGKVIFTCHGDTVDINGSAVLAYGQRARQGSIVCDSETAGITCTNEANKHGFFLSRDSYRIF